MNHPTARRTVAVLVTGLLAGLTAVAQAQDSKAQARDHAERGTRLYEVGKYLEAIEEYQQAYQLGGDPVLLYNIAQAYRLADQPEPAIRAYKNYLRKEPSTKHKDAVEKRIAELEKVVEERKRTGPPSPPTPPAPPGGGATTPPPPPPPDQTTPPGGGTPPPPPGGPQTYPPYPGPPGTGPASTTPPVTGGPPGPGGPGVGQTLPPPPPPAAPVARKSRLVPLSILAVGGALLAVSIVEGAVAAGHAKTVSDASKSGRVFDPSIEKKGKAANAVSILTGLGGLAALGVGGWMLISSRQETPPPGARVAAVVPVVGPDLVGASAEVRF